MNKGLEAIDKLWYITEIPSCHPLGDEYAEEFRIIGKELEALEIMIEKDITPSWFIRNLKKGMTYEDYHSSNSGQYDMTREQFDTLVEVLL